MEKVFVYTADQEKLRRILKLARTMGIQPRELSMRDLPETIGSIVGPMKSTGSKAMVPPFYLMPDVMLFSGFVGKGLDRWLDAYRKAEIEPIPLKAVVTPINSTWSLYQLIEELKREHAAMNR